MVKFTAESDGTRLIGLGITAGNVRRLREGQPIRVDLAEMGVEGVVVTIVYGEDERAIAQALRPYVGPDTIVYDHRNAGRA